MALAATPDALGRHGFAVNRDGGRRRACDLLRYPGVNLERLSQVWPQLRTLRPDVAAHLEIEGQYEGYLRRQDADVLAFRKDEALALPADLDYTAIPSLSSEIKEILGQSRPASIGAAGRLPGVTPAALVALLRYVKRASSRAGRTAA